MDYAEFKEVARIQKEARKYIVSYLKSADCEGGRKLLEIIDDA